MTDDVIASHVNSFVSIMSEYVADQLKGGKTVADITSDKSDKLNSAKLAGLIERRWLDFCAGTKWTASDIKHAVCLILPVLAKSIQIDKLRAEPNSDKFMAVFEAYGQYGDTIIDALDDYTVRTLLTCFQIALVFKSLAVAGVAIDEVTVGDIISKGANRVGY